MNPRQRRGVLLLVVAGIAAIGVFVAIAGYVGGVRAQITPKTTVLALRRDVPAMTPVSPAMVRTISVPERYAPERALRDPLALSGRVAATALPAGSMLQDGMLIAPPALEPGQRELAILVDADTGVAGKIQPGDFVDIEATFPGDQRSAPRAEVVVPHARVVTVGEVQSGAPVTGRGSTGFGGERPSQPQQVVPVTFALSPRQTLIVTYAESFATEVRLALVRHGDQRGLPRGHRQFVLPPTGAGG